MAIESLQNRPSARPRKKARFGARTVLIGFVLLAAILWIHHRRRQSLRDAELPPWSPKDTYVFVDRSDPAVEYLLAFHGREVMVRTCLMPQRAYFEFYFPKEFPASVLAGVQQWARARGPAPTSQPGGAWVTRISLPADPNASVRTAEFGYADKALRRWLKEAREAIVRTENETQALPTWVTRNARVRQRVLPAGATTAPADRTP